jgi:hypothetical protein
MMISLPYMGGAALCPRNTSRIKASTGQSHIEQAVSITRAGQIMPA